MSSQTLLAPRHIQNFSEASVLEPHWGYADRALPCTNDAGSCAYLDVVYHSHDLGMLYVGILWSVVGGILLLWTLGRRCVPRPFAFRLTQSLRRHLVVPQTPFSRLFGRVSRLQTLILAVIAGYLLIFSLVGITYAKWITPVKKMPGVYNTRTSLGPFADRVGILAYGLTPLSILLSSRESILSLLTGVPYHHFNFLHRWLGHIIFAQAVLHTIGWSVVEIRLYQPQPTVAREWIKQTYMVWGLVAMTLLTLLWTLSLPPVIRRTGYEFFRKAHYLLAIVYIGACWGHWEQLRVFLIPSLVIWFLDRAARLGRTYLVHHGFKAADARVTLFDGGRVVRLDVDHSHDPWHVGQHFFLTFTKGSIWQAHPFTPLSLPRVRAGKVRHSYVFRAKGGETRKVADMLAAASEKEHVTTPLILSGPYGCSVLPERWDTNIIAVAGGTGISYVLPILSHLVDVGAVVKPRVVQLHWVVRHATDVEWVQEELAAIQTAVEVHVYATRDEGDEKADAGRPDLREVLDLSFAGATTVYASGPPEMMTDVRTLVADANRGDSLVELVSDERLEM